MREESGGPEARRGYYMVNLECFGDRICQIFYSGLGGHGSVAFSLLEADRGKHQRHSILLFGIEPAQPEYLSKAAELGVEARWVQKSVGADLKALASIIRQLRALRPDLVISHSPPAILAVWAYAFVSGAKVIQVEHQTNAAKTRMDRLWSRVALLTSSAVVVLTEEYRRQYERLHPWLSRCRRVEVIGNGINTDVFEPAAAPPKPGPLRIGMASRLARYRDHWTLIEAVHHLKCEDIQLYIAGTGETQADIEQEINRYGLADRVVLCGLLYEKELVALLQNLDIYVHASAFETMSTSIMQAMAVGLPVVAYDVPGVNNLIEHECTGILIPPKNPLALSQAVSRLLYDRDLRRQLGASARRVAEERLSSTIMLSSYEALFADMIR